MVVLDADVGNGVAVRLELLVVGAVLRPATL
jgi:hypothetical protein